MSTTLEIRGLEDLKAALRHLPAALASAATPIVIGAAQAARADIVAQYPQGPTGNLKQGVRVELKAANAAGVIAIVKSTARHAWIYEHGTQTRQTTLGANRGRMPAPPAPVFIPTMMRTRRAMYAQLGALLEAQGLTVVTR
jgi:hypothetical protein